jgi:hypothetical protein
MIALATEARVRPRNSRLIVDDTVATSPWAMSSNLTVRESELVKFQAVSHYAKRNSFAASIT